MVEQVTFTFEDETSNSIENIAITRSETQRDRFNDLLDNIISQIEMVDDRWEMPWHKIREKSRNACTGDYYSGFNILILMTSMEINQYKRNEWATLRQWNMLGTHVLRGEKGTPIIYPVMRNKEQKDQSLDHFRVIAVFNIEQVAGKSDLQMDLFQAQVAEHPDVEKFIGNTRAKIISGDDSAYYTNLDDAIHLPDKHMFFKTETSTVDETYYSTILHELIHWTGNQSRCNREFGEQFGDKAYAFEELVAELGAAFLCVDLDVSNSPRDDHAKYLKSWLIVLKNDKHNIIKAAGYSNNAIEYLKKIQGP